MIFYCQIKNEEQMKIFSFTFALYWRFKVKECYSRFHFHVLDYCQWLRMPDFLICPRIPHKRIELWGITSTSGHIKFQIANIHFNVQISLCNIREHVKTANTSILCKETFRERKQLHLNVNKHSENANISISCKEAFREC